MPKETTMIGIGIARDRKIIEVRRIADNGGSRMIGGGASRMIVDGGSWMIGDRGWSKKVYPWWSVTEDQG